MGKGLPSLIFMGTPEFALASLKAVIAAGAPILLVVTQPDRPKGRGQKLSSPPVKELALAHGLPVLQPARVKSPEVISRVEALAPACLVVVAYGQILPERLLRIPPLGAVNVHASLLPKYRGAAPIPWALMEGETATGVTTMLLDPGMDTGDTLLSREVPIGPEDTGGSLHDRLAEVGASVLVETLVRLADGSLRPRPQDHSRATYAPMIHPKDCRVNWQDEAERVSRRIRALDPWPGAFTLWQGKRLKLFGCRALSSRPAGTLPGTVLASGPEGLGIAAGGGEVQIRSLQLEGRRRLEAVDFLKGYQLAVGMVLGE
ncbi:MAG TPA: methionyl-tRNA formyltransferase [Syntrophobacteria bacterium]|nr:methionyl-tRNA formyltransferase [Syntrophobacteria bacterium]